MLCTCTLGVSVQVLAGAGIVVQMLQPSSCLAAMGAISIAAAAAVILTLFEKEGDGRTCLSSGLSLQTIAVAVICWSATPLRPKGIFIYFWARECTSSGVRAQRTWL